VHRRPEHQRHRRSGDDPRPETPRAADRVPRLRAEQQDDLVHRADAPRAEGDLRRSERVPMRLTRARSRLRDEGGFALVFMTLVLVVMLVFAAFAVDLGGVYNERRIDQNGVDAATTSGAIQQLKTQT